MTTHPPRIARWLLERLTPRGRREPLIGDMLEQYGRGRSIVWFWRQTINALLANVAADLWQQKGLAISVVAVSACLPQIYMLILPPSWLATLDGWWYPHLINSRWGWLVINPWAYRLELHALTARITWCAFLAGIAWTVGRWRPQQHGFAMTLLLVTQVSLCMPYLRIASLNWWHDPGNPMWFFILLWFSLFTLVAIPFSIWLGGCWGARNVQMNRSLSAISSSSR